MTESREKVRAQLLVIRGEMILGVIVGPSSDDATGRWMDCMGNKENFQAPLLKYIT